MEKIEQIFNEIKKVERFKGYIIFFMMNKYGFVLDKDIDKLKLIKVEELEYEEGSIQGMKALRFKVFDPNNYQPFNSILFAGEKPAAVNVQPEYFIEDEFILN